VVGEAEEIVLQSYQGEYRKLEQIAALMVSMIGQCKERLQERLTEGMVRERNALNEHAKAIGELRAQTLSVRENLTEVVESELKTI
jgi:hypothetical protein